MFFFFFGHWRKFLTLQFKFICHCCIVFYGFRDWDFWSLPLPLPNLPMIFTSLSQYSVGDLECKVQCIFHFLLHFMIESNSNAQWLVTNITIVIRLSQIFVRLFTDLFALAMICTFSHMICLTVRFGKVLSNILDVSKVLIN